MTECPRCKHYPPEPVGGSESSAEVTESQRVPWTVPARGLKNHLGTPQVAGAGCETGIKRVSEYEVIEPIRDDVQEASISASYTPNNGIRIDIINDDLSWEWAGFNLTPDQAEMFGDALIRWARARR